MNKIDETIILEKKLNNSLKPLNIHEEEKIIYQMKKCVCKIYNHNKSGNGFFCKLNTLNLLVTNNHILDSNDIQNGKEITFSLEDGKNKNKKTITINSSRKVYTSPQKVYDITFIQI